jgi:ketosteroid isomerase-like protein
MSESEQFVQRHIEMLLAGDLDQVMQDYLPDAVLRTRDEKFVGTEAVRRHLEEALASAPSESRLEYAVDTRADGQVVLRWQLFVADSTEPVMHGHDEFRLRDGRIAEQCVEIAGH